MPLQLTLWIIDDPLGDLDAEIMRAVVGPDMYPPAYEDDDRVVFEAITVCCVCGKPVEPRTEQEHDAYETLGVHLGDCWQALKRDLARLPSPRRLGA